MTGRRGWWAAFAAIAALNIAVYSPALGHAARGDQVCWLADVARSGGPMLSYNRVREFNPGDELLYRPGLFAVLGIERAIFGYEFAAWQATGLVLHLGVVAVLFALLWSIRPGWSAILLVTFASVVFVGTEMVVWHHLHGYLVFCMLLLGMVSLARRESADPRSLLLIGIVGLAASLFFEFGAVATAVIAAWLVARQPPGAGRWRAAWLGVVPVLYLAANVADWWARGRASVTELPGVAPLDTARNLLMGVAFWIDAGVWPLTLDAVPGDRVVIAPVRVGSVTQLLSVSGLLGLVLAGAIVGAVASVARRRAPLAMLAGALMAAYVLLCVVGRANSRGLFVAFTTAGYYAYVFWILAAVLVHDAVDPDRLAPRWRARGIAFVLVVLIVINAARSHGFARVLAAWGRPRIEALHSAERDRVRPLTDPPVEFLRRRDDPPGKVYGYVEALRPDLR